MVSLNFYKNKLIFDLIVDSDEMKNIRNLFRTNLEKRNTNQIYLSKLKSSYWKYFNFLSLIKLNV